VGIILVVTGVMVSMVTLSVVDYGVKPRSLLFGSLHYMLRKCFTSCNGNL